MRFGIWAPGYDPKIDLNGENPKEIFIWNIIHSSLTMFSGKYNYLFWIMHQLVGCVIQKRSPLLHLIFWGWFTIYIRFSFSFSFSKENLWKSTGVQQAYQRRNEFQLADSAEYFLKNVTKYTADNFVPSDQDVLRTRIQTTGVVKVIYYQHLKWKHLCLSLLLCTFRI